MIFLFIILLLFFEPIIMLPRMPFSMLQVFMLFLLLFMLGFIAFFYFLIWQLSMQQSKFIIFVFFVMQTFILLSLVSVHLILIVLKQFILDLVHAWVITQVLLFFKQQLNEPNQLELLIFLKLNLFVLYQHRLKLLVEIFLMLFLWQLERQQVQLRF